MKKLLIFSFLLFSISSFSQKADSLVALLKKESNLQKKVLLYSELCENLEGEELKKTVHEFLKFSFEKNLKEGKAIAYENLGYYFYSIQEPDSSIAYYQRSLDFYTELKNKEKISHCLHEMGVNYYFKSDLEKALEYYLRNLKINEELNDKRGAGAVGCNIGLIYDKLHQIAKALEWYEKSRVIGNELKDTFLLCLVECNIGYIYHNIGKYDAAEKHFEVGLRYAKKEKTFAYAGLLGNIGSTYMYNGKLDKGIPYMEESVKILREINNQNYLPLSLTNLGMAYSKKGNSKKGIALALEGYEMSKKKKLLDNTEKISKVLAQIYERAGDLKQTIRFLRVHQFLHDSILSEKSESKMNELEVLYETQKKDIELIKKTKSLEDKELIILKEKAESEQKKKFIVILISGLLVLFVAALFVLRAYRSKRKNNQYLSKLNEEIMFSKREIEKQKEMVEEHQKEIIDSIYYARRIQRSLLPTEKYIERVLKKTKK